MPAQIAREKRDDFCIVIDDEYPLFGIGGCVGRAGCRHSIPCCTKAVRRAVSLTISRIAWARSEGGFLLGPGARMISLIWVNARRRGRRQSGRVPPLERTMAVTGTMRAAVVSTFGEPLDIREMPIPQPGRGEVLV